MMHVALKMLDLYIGDLALESVHMGSLQSYIAARKKEGVKNRTINHGFTSDSSYFKSCGR